MNKKLIPKQTKFLIIGTGPTGLGAGHRLQELNEDDFIILDSDQTAGGLAKSITDSFGFTWDIGGHVHFSSFEYYNKLLDQLIPITNWNHHERKSWVYFDDKFVPYPLQKNIHFLSVQNQNLCLEGLRSRPLLAKQNKDFSEWGLQSFGLGIYSIFFEPYNKKVWSYPLNELNTSWVEHRVAPVILNEIEENIRLGRMDANWGPNSSFRYPNGGSGTIWNALADKIGKTKFSFGTELLQIDLKEKKAITNLGEISYSYLINTIPITNFLDRSLDIPIEILNCRSKFRHSSTLAVGLGFEGSPPTELQNRNWIYFPEERFPFFRATLLSGYGRDLTPSSDHWSLLLEISHRPDAKFITDQVVQSCIDSLQKETALRIVNSPKDIWHYNARYGYPTPFLERDYVLPIIQKYLSAGQVYSRGRFGGWMYEVSNQDHSLMQGKEIIDFILLGKKESVYKFGN